MSARSLVRFPIALLEWLTVHVWAALAGPRAVVRYARDPNPRLLMRLLRHYGATIGAGTTLKGALRFDNVWEDEHSSGDFSHLVIGRNCYVGEGVYFDLADVVVLEDDVVVSAEAAFITHSDVNRSAALARTFPRGCAPIVVRRGSWLGFRAVLAHGVTVEPESVVAAGAVVTREVTVRGVFAGIPARRVRELDTGDRTSRHRP
jgi:acetyltransferase-like isoleucine patch superfamily enzyme